MAGRALSVFQGVAESLCQGRPAWGKRELSEQGCGLTMTVNLYFESIKNHPEGHGHGRPCPLGHVTHFCRFNHLSLLPGPASVLVSLLFRCSFPFGDDLRPTTFLLDETAKQLECCAAGIISDPRRTDCERDASRAVRSDISRKVRCDDS